MNDIKAELNRQINEAPEPLRSYIHEMDSFIGNGAHMIQDLFLLREQIKFLTLIIEKEVKMPYQEIKIGKFLIVWVDRELWIYIIEGDRIGEGETFNEEDLENSIHNFYNEHF